MNRCSIVKVHILHSAKSEYVEQKTMNIELQEKIGEGSYGIVFLMKNKHVIKIFKNSVLNKTVLVESDSLLPLKNENRELMFFLNYIKEKTKKNMIIDIYAIGVLKDILKYNNETVYKNNYFIILPFCIPFYKMFSIWNKPLINTKNGFLFTLTVMKRLLDISLFLEKKYNLINLDFKFDNYMFTDKKENIKKLTLLDFSIVKKKYKKKYDFYKKYFIWPNNKKDFLLENIPSYSICINGLELLFGIDKIINLFQEKYLENYLKIIKSKNKNIYNIFYQGLFAFINSEKLLLMINEEVK